MNKPNPPERRPAASRDVIDAPVGRMAEIVRGAPAGARARGLVGRSRIPGWSELEPDRDG
jgi:hypothetical protein